MSQTRTYTHLSPEERAAIMLALHAAKQDNLPWLDAQIPDEVMTRLLDDYASSLVTLDS